MAASPGSRSTKARQIDATREADAALLASELSEKLRTMGSRDGSGGDARSRTPSPPARASRRKGGKGGKAMPSRDAEEIVGITDAQRLRAMLGYGYDVEGEKPAHLVMEYVCACCGTEHKAPHLLDAYYLCQSCQNCLREPAVLRRRWEPFAPQCRLEICYATYGDFQDPTMAYVVTTVIQARVDEIYYRDRLHMRKTQDLAAWFQHLAPAQWPTGDPCPGRNKQLKIRYRMLGLHGTLNLDVNQDNHVSRGGGLGGCSCAPAAALALLLLLLLLLCCCSRLCSC